MYYVDGECIAQGRTGPFETAQEAADEVIRRFKAEVRDEEVTLSYAQTYLCVQGDEEQAMDCKCFEIRRALGI